MAKHAHAEVGLADPLQSLIDTLDVDREDLSTKRIHFANLLIELIEQDALGDDKVFRALIKAAIDQYGVKQQVLADELRTASSNVGRWREGRSTPPLRSRPHDIWGVHRLIMLQEKMKPHPFPNPAPVAKASAKMRATLLEDALTAEDLFSAPDAPASGRGGAAKKPAAPAKSVRTSGRKR